MPKVPLPTSTLSNWHVIPPHVCGFMTCPVVPEMWFRMWGNQALHYGRYIKNSTPVSDPFCYGICLTNCIGVFVAAVGKTLMYIVLALVMSRYKLYSSCVLTNYKAPEIIIKDYKLVTVKHKSKLKCEPVMGCPRCAVGLMLLLNAREWLQIFGHGEVYKLGNDNLMGSQ